MQCAFCYKVTINKNKPFSSASLEAFSRGFAFFIATWVNGMGEFSESLLSSELREAKTRSGYRFRNIWGGGDRVGDLVFLLNYIF
ncbi:MAG: hypothetical protein ABI370_11670 [Gammaproteobacteria bacterium]